MNRKFYGSIEELKNKLTSMQIEYKEEDNKIIIGNGYIKFTEEYLPIRSLS